MFHSEFLSRYKGFYKICPQLHRWIRHTKMIKKKKKRKNVPIGYHSTKLVICMHSQTGYTFLWIFFKLLFCPESGSETTTTYWDSVCILNILNRHVQVIVVYLHVENCSKELLNVVQWDKEATVSNNNACTYSRWNFKTETKSFKFYRNSNG